MMDPRLAALLDPEKRKQFVDSGVAAEPPPVPEQAYVPPAAEQEPATPPEPEPAAVAAVPSDLDANIDTARKQAMSELGQARGASTQTDAQLVSAAPDWYKGLLGAPPKPKSQVLGNLVGAGIAALPQGSDGYWHGGYLRGTHGTPAPDRTNHNPEYAQQKQMIGQAVAGAINNDPATEQYNSNLAAAGKQASLMKTLRDSRRDSNGQSVGAYNALLREKQLKDAEAGAAAKAAADKDSHSMDSAITHEARDAAVATGQISKEEADNMNAFQLQKWRVSLDKQTNRDFSGSEADRRLLNRNSVEIGKEGRVQTYEAAKENRQQQALDQQAAIPGRAVGTVVNGVPVHAPDKAAVERAKAIATSTDIISQNAREMKQIQAQLEQQKHAFAGATGLLEQWAGSPEAKSLLARAQVLQQATSTAQRELEHLGVLQQFEKQMVESVDPQAGSITGFFRGPGLWDAMSDYYQKEADLRLNKLGYPKAGDAGGQSGLAVDNPATAAPKFDAAPLTQYRRRGAQPTGDMSIPTADSSLPVAPVGPKIPLKAVDAAISAPGAKPRKLVTPSGKPIEIPLDDGAYQHMLQSGFKARE